MHAVLVRRRAAVRRRLRSDGRREDGAQRRHQQVRDPDHDGIRRSLQPDEPVHRYPQLVRLRLRSRHVALLRADPADQRRQDCPGQRDRAEQQPPVRCRPDTPARRGSAPRIQHRIQRRRRSRAAARRGDQRIVVPPHLAQSGRADQHARQLHGLQLVPDAQSADRRTDHDLQPRPGETGPRRPARSEHARSGRRRHGRLPASTCRFRRG